MKSSKEYLKHVYDSLIFFDDLPKYGFEFIEDYGFDSTKTIRKVLIRDFKYNKNYIVTEVHTKNFLEYVREILVESV